MHGFRIIYLSNICLQVMFCGTAPRIFIHHFLFKSVGGGELSFAVVQNICTYINLLNHHPSCLWHRYLPRTYYTMSDSHLNLHFLSSLPTLSATSARVLLISRVKLSEKILKYGRYRDCLQHNHFRDEFNPTIRP